MSKSIKSVAKLVTAPIKALYDPVGAIKDVFGGVQGIFAGLTGAAKVSGANSSEPSSQTVRSSKAPVRFILGRVSTGGVLAWVQEQPGDQTSGEWLHIVYVLSEGAIAGVDEIYVDERPLSELGENATSEVIIDPTQANAFLLANCPDWRQEQIGRGLSFVRLSFKYDAEKFPSGIPDVRFVVRGRSDVYDPRNGALGYSANTALLILWYLRNRCAIPDDEIIFESFASAANVCDETVIGPDNTGTRRYFAGAVIGADEKRNTVLDNLLSACAGTLIRVGGRWSLQVGAYYGPADFTINEDMVIGTVEGTTEVSNSDAINTMRGTFIDPAQAWAETDYPEVAIQDWIASDGGELAESQSFAYVTDAYLAQRLANISLRRRRSGGSLAVPLNFNGYNCRPGRAVKVDLPSLNILGEFIVTDWTMGAADACKVTLKPYEQAIFDDAVGQPYDPLGFINLPVGGLAAVTGLAWAPSGVAEVVQGVLSWTPPIQTVLSYTVTIRKGTEVVQSLKIGGEASSCNINGLTSGVYAMSVVAFGPGTRSGEASISVNVGGPPVPESCAVFASVDTITLVPANLQNSLNGGTYEYFYATNPSAPIADAVYLGQGLTFTHTGLAFAREYFYYVRAANAYGKSDFLFVPAATSSDPTQMLDVIAGQITESELGKQLTSRIDLIDMNGPGSVNDRIGTAKTELAQQISEVNNALNTTKGNLQQQITAVST
ncbi:phage tail tip protein J-related protein, partial [Pseudomonas juntendi]